MKTIQTAGSERLDGVIACTESEHVFPVEGETDNPRGDAKCRCGKRTWNDIELLPVGQPAWRKYIEGDVELRSRLYAMVDGSAFDAIARDVICVRLNAIAEIVNAMSADVGGIDRDVEDIDAELRATVQAIVVHELQQIADNVLAKIDAKVIDKIADAVVRKLETQQKRKR